MKSSALMQEIRGKNREELQRMLAEDREHLRILRFKESQSQLRSVRDVRRIRLSIAQVLTAIAESRKKGGLPPHQSRTV
ncbi:MAG: 50S ribosomal protein L29 [Patescibacteria group bacterium]